MKKIFYLLMLFLPFKAISQPINIKKAHQNIIAYLKRQLNDPNSFNVVSWGKVEKIYDSFETSYEGQGMNSLVDSAIAAQIKLRDFKLQLEIKSNRPDTLLKDTAYRLCLKLVTRYAYRVDSLKNVREEKRKYFRPMFDHYNIELTFRAKNGYNALRLATFTFFLDKKMKVTDYETDDN